jgi:hypothetical protein
MLKEFLIRSIKYESPELSCEAGIGSRLRVVVVVVLVILLLLLLLLVVVVVVV